MARDSSRHRERRTVGGLKQLPWRNLRNPYKPIEVLSADHVEAIHDASLEVLEEIGLDFLDADAIEVLRRNGAKVAAGSIRVRFDRGFILEHVAKVPSEVTLHARN